MNIKKSILLLVVAAVVCFLVYLDYARKSPSSGGATTPSGQNMQIKAFEDVAPDKVTRIEVLPPGKQDPIVLEKDGGEWKVRSEKKLYRIAQYKADQIFGKQPDDAEKPELKGPFTLELQARNPENHPDFDLTDDKATHVKFFDTKGEVLEDVLLGKSGTDWQSTFVRFPGKDEVYLADVRLTDNFSGADVDAWRDKRLFPDVKFENVYKLHVDDRANTRTYALAKLPGPDAPDAKWRVTEPVAGPARQSTAESMARTLANVNAAEFAKADDADKFGFDRPTMIARFDVKDQPTTPVLTVGAESEANKGRFYAKTNLGDEVYLIYKPYALSIDPETLIETPTPTPPPPTPEPEMGPPANETRADESDTTGTAVQPSVAPEPAPAPDSTTE